MPVGSGIRADPDAPPSDERVRAVIAAMDPRGAWVEDGTIGKAHKVVSLFAAKSMVLTLGGKSYPVKENDTVDVYEGDEPPRERLIVSHTFARNVSLLAAFVGSKR